MKTVATKICRKCGKRKKSKYFGKHHRTPDGLHSWCNKCRNESQKQYRLANPGLAWEQELKRRNANPEKYLARRTKWREANRDKCRAHSLKYTHKFRSTPMGKLHSHISGAIRTALKGGKNNIPWETLVGYTLDKLKHHLEKKFLPGMTWENQGRHGWHIDHIIPRTAFNYTKPEDIDFKRCWALKNLQPLWAKDNITKNDKIDRPFQPSLAISL